MAEQIKVQVNDRNRVAIAVTDWRFLIRATRKIDPALIDKFKANAASIARPVQTAVKNRIPKRFPITGMEPKVVPGRMTWGTKVAANDVTIQVDTRMRKKGTSIVSVWVNSPATIMADMADKLGDRSGKLTRVYKYSRHPAGERQHRINGQGSGMIVALNKSPNFRKRQRASRMIWPTAEKALPKVNERMHKLIAQTSTKINAEIARNA